MELGEAREERKKEKGKRKKGKNKTRLGLSAERWRKGMQIMVG
jgi:hypothetical protein